MNASIYYKRNAREEVHYVGFDPVDERLMVIDEMKEELAFRYIPLSEVSSLEIHHGSWHKFGRGYANGEWITSLLHYF
jgi:hypothetical protein